MNLKIPTVLILALTFFFGGLASLSAQDDLTIPGVDKETVTAPSTEDVDEERTFFSGIKEGGWAMWPLGAMSIAIIALAVYLFMDLTDKNFSPPELVASLNSDMENGDVEAALNASEASPTCLGQVMYGATEYLFERGYEVLDGETIYDLMADASQEFNRGRAQTINYLSVISQAAPMLGLLGTVSGMIKAFASLGTSGMGNPKVLAANISEALWTTASGLVIALPAVFLYYFFRDKLTTKVAEVDKHASRMLNGLRRTVYAGTYEEQQEQLVEDQGHAPEGPPMA